MQTCWTNTAALAAMAVIATSSAALAWTEVPNIGTFFGRVTGKCILEGGQHRQSADGYAISCIFPGRDRSRNWFCRFNPQYSAYQCGTDNG